jgi:hypothetical protein
MGPGFSERTFEFCYNAEYCRLNAAILATHPHIPSQQAEKDLGYDVEFRINQGHFTRSLFLQHKVASFAEVRAGRNAHFYNTHGQPYFRFPIDNDQHNVLCELSQTKGNAFYCAPRFHLSRQLEPHFRADSIGAHSILLDPLDVGRIQDNERHNITYNEQGGNPTLHSEARKFKKSFGGGKEDAPVLRRSTVTMNYVEGLRTDLIRQARHDLKRRSAITRQIEEAPAIEQVQLILGKVYEVTWLLLP